MKRSRKALAFFVATASALLILAAGGQAAAQTLECDGDTCTTEAADIENDSGAVVVHEDGGSADVDNDSGAVLVHADDGSVEVVNDEGAVAAWADGGSASVSNDEGAVVIHSDEVSRRTSGDSTFFPVDGFFPDRVVVVERVARLPMTGSSVSDVLVMALVMIGIGAALLAAARLVPAVVDLGHS